MSSKQPTVWMNVTTSHNWQRPAVGVVRVEKELTEGLERLIGSAGFKRCVWRENRFVEVHLAAPAVSQTAVSAPPPPTSALDETPLLFPLLPKKAALAAMAQAALSLTPARLRPFANRALLSAKFRLGRYLQNRARATASGNAVYAPAPAHHESQPIPGVEFKAGDILVSVGLDWDHPYWRSFAMLRKVYGLKVVTCCYDLIPVLYPQYCVSDVAKRFTGYFIDVAEGSDLTLCISKQSERDLKTLLSDVGGVDVPTHIFPLGDNVIASESRISPAIAQLTAAPYVLFVSTIERRKNHEVLYRAYHLLCARGFKDQLPKLVFVGMPGWGVSELLKDIELDPLTQGMIVQLNHVSDSELAHLYKHSEFFLFPSLYEGWGLPVGEALALGKAVLCSDRGSLPEVGGDLVTYLDPWVPEAWAGEILRLSTDKAALAMTEANVRTNYKIREWKDSCSSVHIALQSLQQRPFSQMLSPGYDMQTEIGQHAGSALIGDKSGWLMRGPQRAIPAGTYQVRIDCNDYSSDVAAIFSVVSGSSTIEHAVGDMEVGNGGDGGVTLHFMLSEAVHDIEFRCWLSSGRLSINNVVIDQAA
jgi:glycosyltransferase involved in cell wall biosynthesis